MPPSGPVVVQGPQIPSVLPPDRAQVCPGQQSAFDVQAPQFTHIVVPQMNGGAVPPSTYLGSGTHGRPSQQSALDAHDAPASTQ